MGALPGGGKAAWGTGSASGTAYGGKKNTRTHESMFCFSILDYTVRAAVI